MMKVLGTIGALAIAAGAQAGFEVSSVDMGGSGGFGQPITTSTTFYQSAFGNNHPPSSAFIGFVGAPLAEDSYVAIDNNGPSSASYSAAAPGGGTPGNTATTGYFVSPNTLTGGAFTGGGVVDSLSNDGQAGPNGVYGGVFLGRLTTTGVLTGNKVRLLITESSWIGNATIDFVLGGGEGAIVGGVSSNGSTVSGLALRAYASPSTAGNGTVYDLWVEEVPAPGAAALAGVAGLVALRRRRA